MLARASWVVGADAVGVVCLDAPLGGGVNFIGPQAERTPFAIGAGQLFGKFIVFLLDCVARAIFDENIVYC